MNQKIWMTQILIYQKLEYEDKWILSKLNALIKEATANLDNFDMGVYAQKLYDFTWNEFCDWYIEIVKNSFI